MVKIGEKTVVSVTCQDVILQLAEQYCSEGEYLHFGMKENPKKKKYVLVTDEKIICQIQLPKGVRKGLHPDTCEEELDGV